MTTDTTKQDIELKRILGLNDDAPLNDGIRQLMAYLVNPLIPNIVSSRGMSMEAFREFCVLAGQAMASIQEKYSHTPGPKAVMFGDPGMVIKYRIHL